MEISDGAHLNVSRSGKAWVATFWDFGEVRQ